MLGRLLPVGRRGRTRPPAGAVRPARQQLLVVGACLLAFLPLTFSVLAGGFTPHGTQPPLTNSIVEPSGCGACHGNFLPTLEIEPFPSWAGSMMANAARDPIFWAAVDVANHDVPGSGAFCLRCHVPTGYFAGRTESPGGTADGCALFGNIDEPDNDFEGLSCHYCHRIMPNDSPPPGEQSRYFENAQVWIEDTDCTGAGSGPCRRGPYDYPGGGDIPPPHAWKYSEYHTQADFCANCHNVTSPAQTLIDETGTDTGLPYPIERTFKEWQQSDYAVAGTGFKTCQNCHMPDSTDPGSFACINEQNNRANNMPVHRFAGGNTWVPAVLRGEYPTLGRTAEYTQTIAWAEEMLQDQAASVQVTAPGVVLPGQNLSVDVKVTNLSGHKLPTGYTEGRRMWINLVVRNANNQVIWESGAYNTATGSLTEDPQIKIYRSDPGIWNYNSSNNCDIADGGGNPIFHFVLNNCVKTDNRIPPLGFTGGSDAETKPVGYVYPETTPGSGKLVNFDITNYQVPIGGGVIGPITVQARLYYQTASDHYIGFLRDEAVNNNFPDDCITRTGGAPAASRGELLHDLWTTYGRTPPVQMVAGSAVVVVDNAVFADGFETGDTSAWTLTVP